MPMSNLKILKFKVTPGFNRWSKYFPQEAVSHPAKMNLNLLEYLIQHYTDEGDTLLDPMSGTGSMGILAGLNGRNAICIDLEQKFHEMQVGIDCDGYTCHVLGCYQRRELELTIKRLEKELSGINQDEIWDKCVWITDDTGHRYIDRDNTDPETLNLYDKFIEMQDAKRRYEKLPLKPHHYTGCDELYKAHPEGFIERGKTVFLRGDARKLSDLLKEHKEGISACLFSPPFGPVQKGGGIAVKGYEGVHGKDEKLHLRHDRPLSEDKDNISNLPLGEISTIITSPPYKTANEGGGLNKIPPDTFRGVLKNHSFKLSENPDQIDNMPYGNVDTIIPSPPYSEGIGHSQGERAGRDMVGKEVFVGYYGDGSKDNIGNLKHGAIDKNRDNNNKETYLEAMRKVYAECYSVLKPHGLMILVVKRFIRNFKAIKLDEHTKALCESVGFKHLETLLFKLPQQSFWRILYEKKYRNEINKEDLDSLKYEFILVFEKQEA